MYILIDATQVPPVVELRERDDFSSFCVKMVGTPHVWVEPSTLRALAGRDLDVEWQKGLMAMVAFAEQRGWTDSDGRIRAHVENLSP